MAKKSKKKDKLQKSDKKDKSRIKECKAKGKCSNNSDKVLIVLEYENMESMAACLARVSAFIEDPVRHGKAVSLNEAKNVVAARYAGHNFSLINLKKALGALKTLSPPEAKMQKSILSTARKYPNADIYVIAHRSSDMSTLQHEKKHAMFHFDENFRKRVTGIWGMVQKGSPSWAKQFEKHLSDKYAQHVWVDEFQAIVLNREYECATKTVNVLQSVVPKSEPYVTVTLKT
mmetsp:Transcript_2777/g.4030  ORF Transcript_2777/g.4030 Transcript_2777/m.4030 type:complete len:231 (-) Transcript_2777:215-907(-)